MEFKVFESELPGGRVFRVFQDPYPLDPRKDFDNAGKLILWHNRYALGDDHNMSLDDYRENLKPEDVSELVFLYDHSGLMLSIGRDKYPFNTDWNTMAIGYAYMPYEKVKEEFDGDSNKARRCLKAEIDMYNKYLNGDCYAFTVTRLEICECCNNVKEEVEDSVGGFFGCDIKAMTDYLGDGDIKYLKKKGLDIYKDSRGIKPPDEQRSNPDDCN